MGIVLLSCDGWEVLDFVRQCCFVKGGTFLIGVGVWVFGCLPRH